MAIVFASTWAQVAPEAGKTYVVKVVGYGGTKVSSVVYLYHTGATVGASGSRVKFAALPTTITSKYLCAVEADGSIEGAFKLKLDGGYIPSWNTTTANGGFSLVTAASSNYGITYKLEEVSGSNHVYNLRGYYNSAAAAYIRVISDYLGVSKGVTTSDDALQVSFYEASTSSEVVTKSYSVTFSDTKNNDTFTKEFSCTGIKGQPYTITTLPYYTLSNNIVITSLGDEQSGLTATCEPNFPFPFSSATEKNWTYLRLRADNYTDRYVYTNGNTPNSMRSVTKSNISSIRDFVEADASKWAFVKVANTYNQFKIYNKATGDKVLYITSSLTTTRDGKTNTSMADDGTAGYTSFYIDPAPTTAVSNGFNIRPNDNSVNSLGDHNNGPLCYWCHENSRTDVGSVFRIAEPEMLSAAQSCITKQDQSYVGAFTQSAKTTLAATTSTSDFFTKYDELKTQSSSYTSLDLSKIYRIWFDRGTQYPSSELQTANKSGTVNTTDDDVRRIKLVSTATTPATLVKFVDKGEGKYWIQNVNSGLYWGTEKDATAFDPNNPTATPKLAAVSGTIDEQYIGKYSIDYTASGTPQLLGLKDNQISESKGQYLFSPYETVSSGATNDNNICFHAKTTSDGTTFEPGCGVKIQAVTTYPLTIGEAKYASLCLPFSVTMDTGLTAYKVTGVTSADGTREMTLTAITGAIPANEPIIVSATAANTYNLTINLDNTATPSSDNKLTGATVKRTGIDDEYFALGYKALTDGADKTAGFFKVTTQTMPANKAYLLKSKLTEGDAAAANVLLFNFGESTGIKQMVVSTEDENNANANVYYDLNGRRVLYPAHGIYVKANGQKVFIK